MAGVRLVPLSLGEMLDQTFSTFRKHFKLFIGIMVLPQAIIVGLNLIVQIFFHTFTPLHAGQSREAAQQAFAQAMHGASIAFISLVPTFVMYALALGATTYALSEVYLGRDTTIRDSYRVVVSKLWRIVKVIFAVLLLTMGVVAAAMMLMGVMIASLALIPKSLLWLTIGMGFIMVLGMILAAVLTVIFVLRYSVAVPALVVENVSTRQALKRSVALTQGYLLRFLVVGLLMWMISITITGICQVPFFVVQAFSVAKGAPPSMWLLIPTMVLGGAAAAATTPLLMISFGIGYFDLRVRKEGFDLQLMMAGVDEANAPGALGTEPAMDRRPLEDASIAGMCLFTLLTTGLYLPIWFLGRRGALNHLRSREKLSALPALAALVCMLSSIGVSVGGSFRWGSLVDAENALGPIHPLILLLGGIIMLVECFRVRRILLDHLAPKGEGMFSTSVRFQYDTAISPLWTFFLGIFYIQHKINQLLDQLNADGGAAGQTLTPAVEASPVPPVIS